MTSFGWKRKAGGQVSQAASSAFLETAKEDEDAAIASGEIDWLTLAPQKKAMVLEDAVIKSKRLKEEGITLAESERYWEALRKWDQALQLTPSDETLLDMKAQAYLQLNELYPAVQTAEKTLEINPRWWVGHQTLGRARLGLGQVRMALKCFSRAVHLHPVDPELWEEDLRWSAELVAKKKQLEQEALLSAEQEKTSIVELDAEGQVAITDSSVTNNTVVAQTEDTESDNHTGPESLASDSASQDPTKCARCSTRLKSLPENYIVMKD